MNTAKSSLKMTPVVNLNLLDSRQTILDLLGICYVSENGVDQDYVEWDTSWAFSASAQQISEHLVSAGVPKGINVLLKTVKDEES